MPSLQIEGFRLIVNTRGERGHRPHVHIVRAGGTCKVLLDSTLIAFDAHRMQRRDVERARRLVEANFECLFSWWSVFNE